MKKYNSIDGLRTLGAIGIILMHVRANMQIEIDNYVYNTIIPFFTNFVFPFMIISGFGMCCGYYEKIKNNKISINEFYKKRYKKILPFFAILVLIEVIMQKSLFSVYEGFADLTLAFAFLPNEKISVIGVGWTLGIIFAFYMLFPFFVFLLDNKKKAWFSLILSYIFNFICTDYFFINPFVTSNFSPRTNIIYCSIFFIIGGILYLYRENIEKFVSKYKWLLLISIILLLMIYFGITMKMTFNGLFTLEMCVIFISWLVIAIGTNGKILNNKFTNFISKISMEIYLCHMMIFRIIEKLNMNMIFGNNVISYIFVCIATFFGAVVLSILINEIVKRINNILKKCIGDKNLKKI